MNKQVLIFIFFTSLNKSKHLMLYWHDVIISAIATSIEFIIKMLILSLVIFYEITVPQIVCVNYYQASQGNG